MRPFNADWIADDINRQSSQCWPVPETSKESPSWAEGCRLDIGTPLALIWCFEGSAALRGGRWVPDTAKLSMVRGATQSSHLRAALGCATCVMGSPHDTGYGPNRWPTAAEALHATDHLT